MAGAAQAVEQPAKSSKLPLILGVVLALLGGGGGFFATYSGFFGLLGDDSAAASAHGEAPAAEAGRAPDPELAQGAAVSFVPLDPITINLGAPGASRHLRFSAQLEVPSARAAEVTHLTPRILDVINIYLRALDPHEIEEPSALVRLRAQMLRRIRIVAGPDAVNDLLIIEFVFN
jgi:flagellar FliL protein